MISIRTLVLFFILTMVGCSQTQFESENTAKITITSISAKGQMLAEISDPKRINNIISLIDSKKPTLEKMLPIFTMELVIKNGGQEDVWLFAKPHYLKSKSAKNNQIYTVEKHEELTSLMFN